MKIDRGIPLPTGGKTKSKFPFSDMEIGDSFFEPVDQSLDKTRNKLIAAAAFYKGRHPGWDYTTRAVTENGQVGMRLWRTE